MAACFMLVFCSTNYLTLKMEAMHSSEMLVDIYRTTQLCNLELHTLHIKDLLYNFSVQTLTCKFPIIYLENYEIKLIRLATVKYVLSSTLQTPGCGFDCHLEHGCMSVFLLCLCCIVKCNMSRSPALPVKPV
jgi:hypothetical protein